MSYLLGLMYLPNLHTFFYARLQFVDHEAASVGGFAFLLCIVVMTYHAF
jgi:hypothetical protein